jgi:Domain of unknown function (DU1801)
MQSDAKTVDAYIAQLPPERQAAINAVRKIIKANLDPAFEEGMLYGMIGYFVPHSLFPAGYHCDPSKPLCFAGMASQKNHLSVYVMTLYGDTKHLELFKQDWAKSGKKLDMGKCCIRFKKVEDLDLIALGKAVGRVRAREYIASYEQSRSESTKSKAAKKSATKKSVKKKSAAKSKK